MRRSQFLLTNHEELNIWEDDRNTAFHEAGHAVLYELFDVPFSRVEVFNDQHRPPAKNTGYAGIVRSSWKAMLPDWAIPWKACFQMERAFTRYRSLVCILLAGIEAESIHGRKRAPASVARFDSADLKFLGKSFDLPIRSITDDFAPMVAAAFRLPVIWEAVRAVAEALLAHSVLSRAEVQALIARSCGPRATVYSFRNRARFHLRQVAPCLAELVRIGRAPAAGTSYQCEAAIARRKRANC